jgi:transposase
MPAPADVIAAWNDSLSTARVADQFDVPRHTAAHWLRRLRQIGAVD